MKPYFAKYLPIEGEIKVGDKIRSESSSKHAVTVTSIENDIYWTDELNFHAYIETAYLGVKKDKAQKLGPLMLCSRDIQSGDRYFHKLHPFKEFEAIEVLEDKIKNQHYPLHTYPLPNEHLFKVIGEISPEAAKFVKEGEEFDEYELWWWSTVTKNWLWKCNTKDGKLFDDHLASGDIKALCRLKCPWGHFH